MSSPLSGRKQMFFPSCQLLLSLPQIISTLAFSESSASFLSLPHLSHCGHSLSWKQGGEGGQGPTGPASTSESLAQALPDLVAL